MAVAQGAPHNQGPDAQPISNAAPVVLYDGLCGLCDRYVQFVLKHDKRRAFRFAPLQGPFATQALLRQRARSGDARPLVSADAPNTVVLLESPGTPRERVRVRSDAVLAVLAGLGGAWRLVALLRLIPRPIRDAVYRLIARVRHRIFGTLDACAVPPASAGAGRFLD